MQLLRAKTKVSEVLTLLANLLRAYTPSARAGLNADHTVGAYLRLSAILRPFSVEDVSKPWSRNMPDQTRSRNPSPIPVHEPAWEIGTFLRYDQERPDIVSVLCDWVGEVPGKTIDAVMQVLKGDYPENVFLAKLPRAQGWTRKLKLYVPGQESRIVNIIGGGTPRLLLGNEVVYQLPNPATKRKSTVYRHSLVEGRLSAETLAFDEVQGGLSSSLANHIHERMVQASASLGDSVTVPALVAKGRFIIPRWDGSFLVYSEVLNFRPPYYLRPENRYRKFDGKRGVEVFRSGVRTLFQALRQINMHDDGFFHGDLIHRHLGGSANLGFTPEGVAVIKGWGRRKDEHVTDWPSKDRRTHQLQEVTGALAGLLQDVLNSGMNREERRNLLIDTVLAGLEAYTGRHKMIDRVSLASGLPSDMDRFLQSTQRFLSDDNLSDYPINSILYQESGQLEDRIKRWLVKCVTHHL